MKNRLEIASMLAASYTNRNGAPNKETISKLFDAAENIVAEEERREAAEVEAERAKVEARRKLPKREDINEPDPTKV